MKIVLAAASILALSAGAALAGEGNGDPFLFSAPIAATADVPTSPTQMAGQTPLMTKMPPNSVPYGQTAMAAVLSQYRSVPVTQGDVLPTNGSEGPVQTANSLPPGFEDGTVPYEQAESVQHYLAQQNAGAHGHYAQAQQAARTRTAG